ncbi:hypothetical protein ACJ72_00712 [Emergomyces africanus]|uniref:Fungal-type protein kinase domain-containing protein n=1 Tax=Emergomyces africanus TaxID=1955775 RepID=A0A1B7P7A9_9EURO|nr:hypothetical protein ACJ72_00712 [Emergomyces africanus]
MLWYFRSKATGVIQSALRTGPTVLREYQILAVECKPPHKDTPGEWKRTKDGQLRRYLEHITSDSERIIAALAIRTKVRFWQSEKSNSILSHQGAYDLHYEHQRTQAEQVLLYIK